MQVDDRELIDFDGEEYISHDLFHQWFGDLVTCESWSNTPLNESFASYGEYLWNEYHHDKGYADYYLRVDLNSYLRESKTKKVNMIRFDYEHQDDMFDRHSYEKGACIVHMLRTYIGDDAFFASLKLYLERNSFKAVEIHQLRLAFEEITGQDLNWFFNQWFFDKGHPELDITYQWNETRKEISITVKQQQDLEENPLYKLPVNIDIYSSNRIERKKIWLENSEQTFVFPVSLKPLFVNFDADKVLVCTKKDHHTNDEWIYLYNHSKLFVDRAEALVAISSSYTTPSPEADLILKAMHDPHFNIRDFAAKQVEKLAQSQRRVVVRTNLIEMLQNDPSAEVRNSALESILDYYSKEDNAALLLRAIDDSSYVVSGTALEAYTRISPEKGLALARIKRDINNKAMSEILRDLFSQYGESIDADYLHETMLQVSGFGKYRSVPQYSHFLEKIRDERILLRGADYIYNSALNDNAWFIRTIAIQSLIELKNSLKDNGVDKVIQQIDDDLQLLKSAEKDPRVKKLLE
jgi:aminopeptidase N